MLSLLPQLGLFGLALLSSANAANLQVHDASFVPDHVLHLSYMNAPIACTSRPSVVVNGTTPGPLITLNAGQTYWIRVYNDMTDQNATIHWHGLSQIVAPFSDGTPLASQWPIPPQHYFDYELNPTVAEIGSYFYHSHVAFQTVSATGPLVIQEPFGIPPPYQYDAERFIFATELYNRTDSDIVAGLQSDNFEWSGSPSALLINGHSGPADSNVINNNCAPEVIEVEPSKTYRIRMIGAVALSALGLAIQNHSQLTIIAADGSYTKPWTTDHIQFTAGIRFDVLLKTMSVQQLTQLGNGKPKTDFWIPIDTLYETAPGVFGYALLRYNLNGLKCSTTDCYQPGAAQTSLPSPLPGPPDTSTQSLIPPQGDNTTSVWAEYVLQPLIPNGFPGPEEVTRTLYLSAVQLVEKDGQLPLAINNHTWVSEPGSSGYNSTPDARPYLVDIYQRGDAAIPTLQQAEAYYQQDKANNPLYTGWVPQFNAYPAQVGEVIEIVLLNEQGTAPPLSPHPFHAHGGHYYDLGSGPGMYDAAANNAKLQRLQQQNGYTPALRDTTMLYDYPATGMSNAPPYAVIGWRAWRLRVTDAGVWMVHCHILQHQNMGLQSVFVMGNAGEITGKAPPGAGFTNYGSSVTKRADGMEGYTTFAGSAYGNSLRDPVVNHYFHE